MIIMIIVGIKNRSIQFACHGLFLLEAHNLISAGILGKFETISITELLRDHPQSQVVMATFELLGAEFRCSQRYQHVRGKSQIVNISLLHIPAYNT